MDDQLRRSRHALLTPEEMGQADRSAIAAGTPGIVLMERAGAAVAKAAARMSKEESRVAVLAGPGNNGGDGYVAARHLAEAGRRVTVFQLGSSDRLAGDAAVAARSWAGDVRPLDAFRPEDADCVVDALFGAGLSRPVEGVAAGVIAALNKSSLPVLAVDLPSGISGRSGAVLGMALKASRTITFFRKKPGHLLQPGRSHCGSVELANIGIPDSVLDTIAPGAFVNHPDLWRDRLRPPSTTGHKYDRGHAVVFSGGPTRTGAARLAAMAALRGGAGLVTVFSPSAALLVNASHLTAIMLRRCDGVEALSAHLEDTRLNAFVLGPGFGAGKTARAFTAVILKAGRGLVLDADGVTSFQDDPEALFSLAKEGGAELVLTPHAGEFRRLFADIAENENLSKPEKARAAAKRAGAVLVLKGADTVIAAPDGRAAINDTGTPWLATAGTGDVLAGIIAAQLAQGMPAFKAAGAGVWMHGKAAEAFGPGMIAEDLPNLLPSVWSGLV